MEEKEQYKIKKRGAQPGNRNRAVAPGERAKKVAFSLYPADMDVIGELVEAGYAGNLTDAVRKATREILSKTKSRKENKMSTATLGYTDQFSQDKIEAIKAWAIKWNATEKKIEFRDTNLEDRNFSGGLIATQEEQEDYLNKPQNYQTMVEYIVKNASKECWQEQRQILRM